MTTVTLTERARVASMQHCVVVLLQHLMAVTPPPPNDINVIDANRVRLHDAINRIKSIELGPAPSPPDWSDLSDAASDAAKSANKADADAQAWVAEIVQDYLHGIGAT